MRILFVNRLFSIFWGGGETFDYNLAKTLISMGHTVSILTGLPLFSKRYRNEIKDKDINVIYIKTPYLRWISYKIGNKIPKLATFFMLVDLYFFQKKTYQWLKNNADKFDIIEILNLPYLTKKVVDNLKKPVVVRFPGPPSDKWELDIYKRIKNKAFVKFFAAGDTVRILHMKNFLVEEIPQGVDFDRFVRIENNLRDKLKIKEEDVLLISCGRLIPGKGFEFLIEGFKVALETYKNLKLLIVGDGELKFELEKKVEKLSLKDNVIFTGRIGQNSLPFYYSIADIFLLTSSYENFSNAVLEAMSCELPVIATNVGGFPLQIKNGINGFLVNYGDIKDLCEKILYLVNNPELRIKMGKTNRKEVLEKYNWESSAKKVLNLYEDLLNRKKKIIFVIPNLGKGGAERVFANILRKLSRNKFEIVSIFYDNNHIYEIPDDIKIYNLDLSGTPNFFKKIYRNIVRIMKISQIIKNEKPDVVFSFINRVNLSTIISKILSRSKTKVIISERNTPSLQQRGFLGFITKLFMRIIYNKADCIIAVSNGVKNDLIKNFGIKENKISVIYNPIDIDEIQKLSKEEITECEWFKEDIPIIINVGSLTEKKGHKYLLHAFKIVREKVNCRLVILGEGPKEKELKELAKNLGISNDVKFLGFQKNPFKFIAKSNIFVLSSLFEGFPNVLIEAMVCGVPVISTNCPSGPDEIINNGTTGFLVGVYDEQKMADRILEVITNKSLIGKLTKNAFESIKKFDVSKIIEQYINLIYL
ncbi:MAG: glycosyltransferase [Candidatus Pacearchaeota archaeon]